MFCILTVTFIKAKMVNLPYDETLLQRSSLLDNHFDISTFCQKP